jgi:hypothetical protein
MSNDFSLTHSLYIYVHTRKIAPPAGAKVVVVAAGWSHTCAVTGGARLWCWGFRSESVSESVTMHIYIYTHTHT